MNAETGSEPESPKKRGRIPQSAWPQILDRYRSGATLSAIAREFECTPSAISYIIKKAEAAGGQGELKVGDDTADAADDSTAAPVTEAAAEVPTPAAPEPAPAEAAPPAPPAAEEPRRDARPAGRTTTRGTLTRTPRAETPADSGSPAETPAAPAAPAPTETLRLNRPEPAPAPVPTPVAPAPAAPAAAAVEAAAPRVAGQPSAPVDAVEGRLRDTAKACISAYRGWKQQPSETTIQSLSETVHELRKALARVEIDMSASRREEQAIRPIPIPAHRASRRPN
ncbi:helix-turn-helix domain containing protein [Azospirillum sp. TSO35-2]|uniref:helix-turn-helix domain containing protein n=1 Tax=Azospirillum sp. TSO35-2 TaxID=716796 RepID=UPI000D65A6B5|nr:helix-turn-helix domain containing protein [Azospirillum sp. TSO35-2]